jgi:tetratricopeptide (TPR) repeat protein
MSDHIGAQAYHERALAMRMQVYGAEAANVDIARSLYALGDVCFRMGGHDGAQTYHEQALVMYRRTYGAEAVHIDIVRSLYALGDIYQSKGDHKGAEIYHDMANVLAIKNGSRTAPWSSTEAVQRLSKPRTRFSQELHNEYRPEIEWRNWVYSWLDVWSRQKFSEVAWQFRGASSFDDNDSNVNRQLEEIRIGGDQESYTRGRRPVPRVSQ